MIFFWVKHFLMPLPPVALLWNGALFLVVFEFFFLPRRIFAPHLIIIASLVHSISRASL